MSPAPTLVAVRRIAGPTPASLERQFELRGSLAEAEAMDIKNIAFRVG
jgi:hypothetical protein